MTIHRRDFFKATAIGGVGAAFGTTSCSQGEASPFAHLQPMTDGIQPITDDERRLRIEKAQRLMRANRIDALFLDVAHKNSYSVCGINKGGPAHTYFPGNGAWGVRHENLMKAQ